MYRGSLWEGKKLIVGERKGLAGEALSSREGSAVGNGKVNNRTKALSSRKGRVIVNHTPEREGVH